MQSLSTNQSKSLIHLYGLHSSNIILQRFFKIHKKLMGLQSNTKACVIFPLRTYHECWNYLLSKKKKKKDFLDNRYDEFGHTLQELLALKDWAFNCSLPLFAVLLIMPQISSQAQRTPFQGHLLHKHQEA